MVHQVRNLYFLLDSSVLNNHRDDLCIKPWVLSRQLSKLFLKESIQKPKKTTTFFWCVKIVFVGGFSLANEASEELGVHCRWFVYASIGILYKQMGI